MADEQRETKRVQSYDELFPGRFLKAGLLKGKPVTLTISDVFVERMPEEDGRKKWRGILAFEKTEMQLALNRTNGECLKAMFGERLANWKGKRVTLFPTMVQAFGEEELAIRVLGSPDIARDMQVDVVLPRKKPKRVTLKRTGKGAPKQEAPPQEEPPADMDALTGEVPFEDEAAA